MKRSEFKRKTEIKRGDSVLARSPMNRGSSQLTTTTPMARSTKPMAAVGERAKRMRQGKVAANAAEQAWMDQVRAFGCIVCWLHHNANTPCVVHHILSGGRRMGHMHTLGLCEPGHHQQTNTRDKISRHPDKARFEAAYGTEAELLTTTRQLLGYPPL